MSYHGSIMVKIKPISILYLNPLVLLVQNMLQLHYSLNICGPVFDLGVN